MKLHNSLTSTTEYNKTQYNTIYVTVHFLPMSGTCYGPDRQTADSLCMKRTPLLYQHVRCQQLLTIQREVVNICTASFNTV
jgi:hypothetical protein